MSSTFYVVWCPENGPPTVRHKHCSSAEDEAIRLAKKHPEKTFIVLRALSQHKAEVRVANHWLYS